MTARHRFLRPAVASGATVVLFAVLAAAALANAEVSYQSQTLEVEVEARSGADGDHGIIVEPFRERGGRNGWRVRADRFGRPAFFDNSNLCFTNGALNDTVCTGPRVAVSVDTGDGADTVAVREIPAGTYTQPEPNVQFTIGSASRNLPVGAPDTPDPIFDCRENTQREAVSLDVRLGGSADFFVVALNEPCTIGSNLVAGITSRVVVRGEGGADAIRGGSRNDELSGGSGDDRLEGAGGNDQLSGGGGGDRLVGGPGDDTTTYEGRADRVVVRLANTTDSDGADGEGDVVLTENVVGGDGNDTLFGDVAANELTGGAGTDTLDGFGGRDRLFGGPDPDQIGASDGGFDEISCGGGADFATGDLADFFRRDRAGGFTTQRNTNALDCEAIDSMAIDDGPPGRALGRVVRRESGGTATITVACPRRARITCRGTLTVRLGRAYGRIIGRAPYAAPVGARASVRVRLRPVAAGSRIFVHTVERGVSKKGPRRSQRLLRVG